MSVDEDGVYNDALDKAMSSGDMDTAKEVAGMIAERRNARAAAPPSSPQPSSPGSVSADDMLGGIGDMAKGAWREVKSATDVIGSGITKAGQGALSALSGGYAPEVSRAPDLVDEKSPEDKALMNTPGGKLGSLAVNSALTGAAAAPLGEGIAAIPSLFKRALARVGAGTAEGAAGSALNKESAEGGATGGAALSVLTGVLGKLGKGTVGKSDAAQRLLDAGADFIPISQGGKSAASRGLYQAMGSIPGAGAQMSAQARAAKDSLGNALAQSRMPTQVDASGRLVKDAVVGDTGEQTAQNMRAGFDRSYDNTIHANALNVPEDFHGTVLDNLADAKGIPEGHKQIIANKLDSIASLYAPKGVMDGQGYTNAIRTARESLGGLRDTDGNAVGNPATTEKAMRSFHALIDNNIAENSEIKATAKGATDQANATQAVRDLENYQKLPKAYKAANAVASTFEDNGLNRGAFEPKNLYNNAAPNSQERSIAQDAHEVLDAPTAAGHGFGHVATPLGLAFTAMHSPGLAVGALGGANVMATKAVQKGLYGDFDWQKTLAKTLRNNPNAASALGAAARQGVIDDAQQ